MEEREALGVEAAEADLNEGDMSRQIPLKFGRQLVPRGSLKQRNKDTTRSALESPRPSYGEL